MKVLVDKYPPYGLIMRDGQLGSQQLLTMDVTFKKRRRVAHLATLDNGVNIFVNDHEKCQAPTDYEDAWRYLWRRVTGRLI